MTQEEIILRHRINLLLGQNLSRTYQLHAGNLASRAQSITNTGKDI